MSEDLHCEVISSMGGISRNKYSRPLSPPLPRGRRLEGGGVIFRRQQLQQSDNRRIGLEQRTMCTILPCDGLAALACKGLQTTHEPAVSYILSGSRICHRSDVDMGAQISEHKHDIVMFLQAMIPTSHIFPYIMFEISCWILNAPRKEVYDSMTPRITLKGYVFIRGESLGKFVRNSVLFIGPSNQPF